MGTIRLLIICAKLFLFLDGFFGKKLNRKFLAETFLFIYLQISYRLYKLLAKCKKV